MENWSLVEKACERALEQDYRLTAAKGTSGACPEHQCFQLGLAFKFYFDFII